MGLKRFPPRVEELVEVLGYVIRVRIRVRFRIRLRSGWSDYNLATLQSVVPKFRTDALSVLERVKRLNKLVEHRSIIWKFQTHRLTTSTTIMCRKTRERIQMISSNITIPMIRTVSSLELQGFCLLFTAVKWGEKGILTNIWKTIHSF